MNTPLTRRRVDSAEIVKSLRLVLQPGQVTELRALEATLPGDRYQQIISGYFDDAEKLAEAVASIVSAKGIYFTPNSINPALLARAANRIRPAKKEPLTADHDVVQRHWLLGDADPVRPAGISSTEAEHDAAIERVRAIADVLGGMGWSRPILVDSGNGAQFMYRIDLPADDDGLVSGQVKSLDELSTQVGLERSYLGRILRLAMLAPDIVQAILAGKEPGGLSVTRLRHDLPLTWVEQRRALARE